ncbi:TetR/AcrR family transcriptional regulator [Sphingobacterium sp. DR205]|uniref:TetR/AcrR family transcriptional regulator n=1 Tax=Sphingobacterium sp. DR205 TaxID=2713573 RepID=UPI0013E4A3A6|nr:TetR/AcrR family transcriptional regulator [Sphingobacterium sp. DR205]QIH34609.1 TetR/AcrR family transcriptional regulator [Sphingobacterium sp. DR205]
MKRIQILKAGLKLFVLHGVHAVTIAQIAAEAKVGIGTVYRYFTSKENIVQQIWIQQKSEESAYIFKNYTPQGSIREQFDYLWKRVIYYFLEHPLEFQFSYQFAASPILTKEIHEIAMKDFLAFDALYAIGLKEHMFKPLSARRLRLFTFSTINGWILWALDEKMDINEDIVNMFIQMCWDAISI